MSDSEIKQSKLRIPKLRIWQWGITAAVALLVISGGIWTTITLIQKPNLNNVHVVVNDVGRHYLLPSNETPALLTITDKAKLTSSFFKQANNGDKVLVYQTNQIAIIYRPSIDRIIAVGPVSIDTPPSAQSNSGQ